jgi:hypothetical protein
MTAPLRINEALLIANHAFKPFQCVAWAPQDGNGELSLTVIDRTNSHIGRKQIPAAPTPIQRNSSNCCSRFALNSAKKVTACNRGRCHTNNRAMRMTFRSSALFA